MTDLSAQQALISEAIHVLVNDQPHLPDLAEEWQRTVRLGLVDSMRFAMVDHEHDGSPVESGDCYAVVSARKVLDAVKGASA